MNSKLLPLGVAAISLSVPVGTNAQVAARCSDMEDIYVLARGIYTIDLSGSCVYRDGYHSPYLTKSAYDALTVKPKFNKFYGSKSHAN